MKLEFFVLGNPATAGSKKAFHNKKTGRTWVVDTCKRKKSWQDTCATYARKFYQGPPTKKAVKLLVVFIMPRPKYHYDSKGEIKTKYVAIQHLVKPDVTKLFRCLEDSFKDILWHDDSQVIESTVMKYYTQPAFLEPEYAGSGAKVKVEWIDG